MCEYTGVNTCFISGLVCMGTHSRYSTYENKKCAYMIGEIFVYTLGLNKCVVVNFYFLSPLLMT